MRCLSCGKAELETEAIYRCPACGDDYTGGLAAKVIDAHVAAFRSALAAAERRAEEAETYGNTQRRKKERAWEERDALASRVSALEGALRLKMDEYRQHDPGYCAACDAARAALSAPALCPKNAEPFGRAPAPGDATARCPVCGDSGYVTTDPSEPEPLCRSCDYWERPAPAAGSPDTRTLGKSEGETAGAPSENTNPGRRPAHMKNEGE